MPHLLATVDGKLDYMYPEEVVEMSEPTINAISIVTMALGSILMLAVGFGFASSNNVILAGVVCFIFSISIVRIFKKTRTTP